VPSMRISTHRKTHPHPRTRRGTPRSREHAASGVYGWRCRVVLFVSFFSSGQARLNASDSVARPGSPTNTATALSGSRCALQSLNVAVGCDRHHASMHMPSRDACACAAHLSCRVPKRPTPASANGGRRRLEGEPPQGRSARRCKTRCRRRCGNGQRQRVSWQL
jgi:hypothetical protein